MSDLKVTFQNGETASIRFGVSSTLAVETPDGVNGSVRSVWSEIVAVEIDDTPVAVPDASADPFAGAPVAGPIDPIDPNTVAPDPAVEVVAPGPPAAVSSDTSVMGSSTASTSSATTTEAALYPIAHDDAVAAAQDALTSPTSAGPEFVKQALADVEQALASYPDSVELADAKAQLEQQIGTA